MHTTLAAASFAASFGFMAVWALAVYAHHQRSMVLMAKFDYATFRVTWQPARAITWAYGSRDWVVKLAYPAAAMTVLADASTQMSAIEAVSFAVAGLVAAFSAFAVRRAHKTFEDIVDGAEAPAIHPLAPLVVMMRTLFTASFTIDVAFPLELSWQYFAANLLQVPLVLVLYGSMTPRPKTRLKDYAKELAGKVHDFLIPSPVPAPAYVPVAK